MSDDALSALLEVAVKLTPDERRRLLREAEVLLAGRTKTGPSLEPSAPSALPDDDFSGRGETGAMPCPRCGLVPGPSDIFCTRCGNRVDF